MRNRFLHFPARRQATLQPSARRLRWVLPALLAGTCALATGCGAGNFASDVASHGLVLNGHVQGGQQVVTGSKIYLYAASTTGYATASTSLLNAPGYVTTDAGGNFTITADYTCPAGAYVYALALGGNPGLTAGTNNSKIGLMAGLGPCSSLTPATFISLDEVTTIAAAYALAPFAASETAVGTSGTNVIGLKNAFAVIPNLVTGNGYAVLNTAAGNGLAPQAAINTLADALASCINSDGTAAACGTLFTAAGVTGAGGTPTDTIQAAINIAHNPGANVASIYGLSSASGPFQPTLTAAPNDWTLQIQYTGGLNQVQGLSVDANGNVYASNSLGANITEFSPVGTVLGTLTSPTLYRPQEMGIDTNGNLWVGSRANANVTPATAASLVEFSSNGTLLSGVTGFTGGGISAPRGVAVDNLGNIWTAGNAVLSEFTSAGVAVSSNTGYTSPNLLAVNFEISFDTLGNAWVPTTDANTSSALIEFVPIGASFNAQGTYGGSFRTYAATTTNYPLSVAIDASNDVWVSNTYGGSTTFSAGAGSLTEYTNAGTELSPTLGYQNGGIVQPQTVTIDGLGNVYAAQVQVGVLSKTGAAVAPSTGYQSVNQNDCCLASAIDSSGGYWTSGTSHIYQWVGLAAPVATPKVKGVVNGTLAARP